ncbi:hypothetical protein CY34DRAFT_19618 [Suillus luteus UH-Slu-Lm8-n1]|uniref:Uncharacterized protein n=1 Tax=Suillus luteus UH-Slu-Lm8-n1 TaxID=930992 RepID=A0A0D0AI82_9AGAM|nr:hypothetical protein CY34DRAFT_19618 [Suillus luteus UH-Slu-Lm8-n1]
MPEISDMMLRRSKGKSRARRIRKKRAVSDSEDESKDDDEDDDISGFIFEDGEDEEEKDARRDIKKRLGTRRAMIVESDDEFNINLAASAAIFNALTNSLSSASQEITWREFRTTFLDNAGAMYPVASRDYYISIGSVETFERKPDEAQTAWYSSSRADTSRLSRRDIYFQSHSQFRSHNPFAGLLKCSRSRSYATWAF